MQKLGAEDELTLNGVGAKIKHVFERHACLLFYRLRKDVVHQRPVVGHTMKACSQAGNLSGRESVRQLCLQYMC